MEDYQKLWNFVLLWKKTMVIFQTIEVFEQMNIFKTLIYHGKTMVHVLWKKNYGTMEKNYYTIPRAMELWFTVEKAMVLWEKLWYYGKNYGTLVNYS